MNEVTRIEKPFQTPKVVAPAKSWHRRLAGARENSLFTAQARRLCHHFLVPPSISATLPFG
jgi:hypothetical protein